MLAIILMVWQSSAFIIQQIQDQTPLPKVHQMISDSSSEITGRRDFLQSGISTLASISVLGASLPAFGLYEKQEELQGNIFKKERNEKLASLTAAIAQQEKALEAYELYVAERDFYSIRGALRRPPFADIRKDSTALISLLEGDEKKKVQKVYDSFKIALEKFDRVAGKGTQGELKDEREIDDSYAAAVAALKKYLSEIPSTS